MLSISASQCRAARGLLKWSQPDLSARSGVNVQTISAFEKEAATPTKRTLQKLTMALEIGGVEFMDNGGVAPRALKSRHLKSSEGFRELMDDVYEQARTVGGDFRLWNAKPDNWIKWLGVEWNHAHSERMKGLQENIRSFYITCKQGETNFLGRGHAEYRWVPAHMFNEHSIYCYADRIAFLNFEENDVSIYVLYNKAFVDSFRLLFDLVWDEITTLPSFPGYKPGT